MVGGTKRTRGLVVGGWALVLAVIVLGPALGPGYVLSYDMVWTPHLALRPDFLGAGTALPRAVPSDAVVAVLDTLTGGMLLQKVVLVGGLAVGGLGAARLVRDSTSLGAALVAVTIWEWNPLVVERLVLGQWPLLLGYAALPWLILLLTKCRHEGVPPGLLALVPLGSLSAASGLLTAVAVVAFGAGRSWRRNVVLAVVLLAGNAPWLVAGALHAGDAVSDPAGAEVFGLRSEGALPAPVTALGLGGVWNSEVVPASRTGVLGVLATVLVLALAGFGASRWWRGARARTRAGYLVCWGIGWVAAVLTWAVPGPLADVYAHVPGSALLRDGARTLVLCAPLLVVLGANGAERVLAALPMRNRPPIALALVLLPIALLPDAAWGVDGRLRAVHYPAGWDVVRSAVADRGRGDVLVLPLTSYRQPAWNRGVKVFDPLGRFLTRDYVASDVLVVRGRTLSGEDARVREATAALGAGTAEDRARRLARIGIGTVVTDRSAGPAPAVSGRPIARAGGLRAVRLNGVAQPGAGIGAWIALTVAWTVYAVCWAAGAVLILVRRRRRRTRDAAV